MHLNKGKIPLILCDALSAGFLPVLDLRGQGSLMKALSGFSFGSALSRQHSKTYYCFKFTQLFYVQGECMTVTKETGFAADILLSITMSASAHLSI